MSHDDAAPVRLAGISDETIRKLAATLVKRREARTLVDARQEERDDAAAVYDVDVAHQLAALFECAFLMAAADGDLSQVELEETARSIAVATDGLLDEEAAWKLIGEYAAAYRKEGFKARLRRVTNVLTDGEWRRAAVQLAARVAYADGALEAKEEEAFAAFARYFDIAGPELTALVERVLRPSAPAAK